MTISSISLPRSRQPSTSAPPRGGLVWKVCPFRYLRRLRRNREEYAGAVAKAVREDRVARNTRIQRVSPSLLACRPPHRVLTNDYAASDHPRDKWRRFREDPARSQKSCFARFHCARKAQRPNPTPHSQSSRTNTSNEVSSAQTGRWKGSLTSAARLPLNGASFETRRFYRRHPAGRLLWL